MRLINIIIIIIQFGSGHGNNLLYVFYYYKSHERSQPTGIKWENV